MKEASGSAATSPGPATTPTGKVLPTFPEPAHGFFGRAIGMRWKLLAAFAGAFTLVFGFLAIWDFRYVTDTAHERLVSELASSATGGARTLDADLFAQLIATVPPSPDPSSEYGLGYPDSPLYLGVSRELLDIREVLKDAGVYTYFRDPVDGKMYFAASGAFIPDPENGVPYKVPVADVVGPETYANMEHGLITTTNEPQYSDKFGDWISSFAPIKDSNGTVVGALGLDYPLTYVDAVQRDVQKRIVPVLLVSYAVLLLLVLGLSTTLTRPLKRLTAAVTRVAEGEYDLDLSNLVPTRFPDEMYTLAEAFSVMAVEVAQREADLTHEVQRLTVEIDQTRREESVREITDSDFFYDLTAKAAIMRKQMRGEETP